jgi:hypothetical protein
MSITFYGTNGNGIRSPCNNRSFTFGEYSGYFLVRWLT